MWVSGLGHYDLTDEFTLIKGDLANERIVDVSSRGDCILAVSGQSSCFKPILFTLYAQDTDWTELVYRCLRYEIREGVCIILYSADIVLSNGSD